LREAYATAERPALLWSMGKDSNVMLWLARRAFFGRVPFPVVHVDTGLEFAEIYAFRDRLAEEWRLDLLVAPCPPLEAMDPTLPPNARSASRKTAGLRDIIAKRDFDAVIAAIRRDEQTTRAKERVFSPRGDDNAWKFREQPPELWGHFALGAPPGGSAVISGVLTALACRPFVRRAMFHGANGVCRTSPHAARSAQRRARRLCSVSPLSR
jgi:sulfate adenylyltransferase subunit 2